MSPEFQEQRVTPAEEQPKSRLGRFLAGLRKTALVRGIKKAGSWIGTKLGVGAGAAAAGTAVGGPVGTAVGIAVTAVGEVVKKVKSGIVRLVKKPEEALGWVGAGAIALVVLPMPIALVGIVPIALGGIGLISWSLTSVGAIAGGFAAKATAFFVALTTAPITAPIALFVVGVIGILMVTTFFIVMTTAGAFILPVGPAELIEEYPPPPAPPPPIPPPPGLTFRWPVDSPMYCSLGGNYGYRIISAINDCNYHEGIDIPASLGSPVYSTAEGVVYDIGPPPNTGYGIYVIVKHNGLFSIYAHLAGTAVFEGERVDQSSVLGYVDNTGYSFGTHLHFGFSECGSADCFMDGRKTRDPCNYLTTANPACPSSCGYRDRTTGCPGI